MPLIPIVLLGRAASWFDVEAIEDTCFRYVDLDLTMQTRKPTTKKLRESRDIDSSGCEHLLP